MALLQAASAVSPLIDRSGGFHPPTWEAHPGRSSRWMEIRGRIVMFGDVDGWLNEGVVALVADNRAEWAHIARHDPDRVLQDVESGRRVLEWAHTSTAPLADRIAVVAALAYRSKPGPSGQQEEAL